MAEDVFWRLLAHLKATDPKFCSGQYGGYLSRIRSHGIFLLDSSTIQLTLNCFDGARHKCMKAAAKLHMTMELSSRLPSFAIVEDAAHHDSTRAAACTAQLGNGDILVADVHLREVERQHLVAVSVLRGILPDFQVAEESVEVSLLGDIVIAAEHARHEQLAKPARAHEEKERPGQLQHADESGFVDEIVTHGQGGMSRQFPVATAATIRSQKRMEGIRERCRGHFVTANERRMGFRQSESQPSVITLPSSVRSETKKSHG